MRSSTLSNYFGFAGSRELGRIVEPWLFDAAGRKAAGTRWEEFFAVDYVDRHILKSNCGNGLHRHWDNQELFFLLDSQALMVAGDWCKTPERERCFEVRTLRPGHFSLLKPGGLHALMDATDSDIFLLMLDGYDCPHEVPMPGHAGPPPVRPRADRTLPAAAGPAGRPARAVPGLV